MTICQYKFTNIYLRKYQYMENHPYTDTSNE